MSGRTPGPWQVAKDCGGFIDKNYYAIYDKDGVKLAWVFGSNVPQSEGEANAAFIVQAVNAHDALVEALRLAVPWFEGEMEVRRYKQEDCTDVEPVLGAIRAALKLAEGGK